MYVELKDLRSDVCLLVWDKLKASNHGQLLQGIECQCLSSYLISSHDRWFNPLERETLGRKQEWRNCMDIVHEALKRNPGDVLCAFREALLATQTSGGATQHANIAQKLSESKFTCNYVHV